MGKSISKDYMNKYTGSEWNYYRSGFNGSSAVFTSPDFPGIKVVSNSWFRLIVNDKKVCESRAWEPVWEAFKKAVDDFRARKQEVTA